MSLGSPGNDALRTQAFALIADVVVCMAAVERPIGALFCGLAERMSPVEETIELFSVARWACCPYDV